MAIRVPACVLAVLVFGAGLGACFNAPAADVMFGCVDDESVCPVGYTCEADGCCHRDGSDVDAHLGECQLGGGQATSGGATSSTGGTGGTSGATSTTGETSGEGTTGVPSTTSGTSSTTGTDTTSGSTTGTTSTSDATTGGTGETGMASTGGTTG